MATGPMEDNKRFPWGYFVATLLPVALIGAIFLLPALVGAHEALGPAMLCSLLIGPAGALVVGWGVIWLWRGEGRWYPALRWLVWLPLLVGLAGFALS